MMWCYGDFEDKFGKKNMTQCSELYRKYVIDAMCKSKKEGLVGIEKYLSRINPILGGRVNTKELFEDIKAHDFFDQVIILCFYLKHIKK